MSKQYDDYLHEHKTNVLKGFKWMKENIPEILGPEERWGELEWQINQHDFSKNDPEEYNAYDAYFYGGNRSYQVVQNYKYAWLRHIHLNPHHWQYWALLHDEADEGMELLTIPHNYIIEMICDWWSFSWKTGNLYEIFDWYEKHAEYFKLSTETRTKIDSILGKIRVKLDEMKDDTHE